MLAAIRKVHTAYWRPIPDMMPILVLVDRNSEIKGMVPVMGVHIQGTWWAPVDQLTPVEAEIMVIDDSLGMYPNMRV